MEDSLSLDTRRTAIVLHIQDTWRYTGYDSLRLELTERPDKYLVHIYTRGWSYPCDSSIYIHDKDMELAQFADTIWNKVREELL